MIVKLNEIGHRDTSLPWQPTLSPNTPFKENILDQRMYWFMLHNIRLFKNKKIFFGD